MTGSVPKNAQAFLIELVTNFDIRIVFNFKSARNSRTKVPCLRSERDTIGSRAQPVEAGDEKQDHGRTGKEREAIGPAEAMLAARGHDGQHTHRPQSAQQPQPIGPRLTGINKQFPGYQRWDLPWISCVLLVLVHQNAFRILRMVRRPR